MSSITLLEVATTTEKIFTQGQMEGSLRERLPMLCISGNAFVKDTSFCFKLRRIHIFYLAEAELYQPMQRSYDIVSMMMYECLKPQEIFKRFEDELKSL